MRRFMIIVVGSLFFGVVFIVLTLARLQEPEQRRPRPSMTEVDGEYMVSEVEILSALGESGRKFRLANVVYDGFERDFPEKVRFDGSPEVIGLQGFPRSDGLVDVRKEAPGEWKESTSTLIRLTTMFVPISPAEISNNDGTPVRFRVKLVKKCPVHVKLTVQKDLKNTGSGVIAIPKFVESKFTDVTMPACYEPGDRVFELF